MGNLINVIPVYQTNYKRIILHAWDESLEDNPYTGVAGGQHVSPAIPNLNMVLEVTHLNIAQSNMPRLEEYARIPHEYFHAYQHSLSKLAPLIVEEFGYPHS